ncbi:ArnT family glycosyltransferase [Mucilaginibacter myungsuensis]|uniref:Glycosyltransferase family 39 protein n=1 Tax=Mucilaginibacter myungsuensis TaxID=649104 RepID=A0A929L1C7_9SPHI|nr:glycosyltransferase family 39 protein [Mucilaginibacter myungsuensis]MBE9664412.1 glycosyltransferase family 39 protein [Mucilaginibacter myungsuensis]MDN3597123.1 glycosyltransferase family 39 protein [Mucilaginibacter myungsuensis]
MTRPSADTTQTNRVLWILFFTALVVNFATINLRFFSDDPALYGSIAKQLIYHNTIWDLYSYSVDWLDKPHFPFWAIAVSFKLFGISTWSYKLPAIICYLLSMLYTWMFAKKYYSERVGIMAMLIVSTSLHIIMSNTDVRAEPYLMAFITGAIYHIAKLQERFNLVDLLLCALLTAFAIMTKGIFVVIPIGAALGGHLLLTRQFREVFRLKWLALIILTIIFTLPEVYALYVQFDLHPEKVVFEKTGVSGIKWFLYDSQFGRFNNDGPITRPSGDPFFFVHTLLWALAPWCLIFYYATGRTVKRMIKGVKQPEYYAFSGSMVLLLLFSISSFQLPFYTNIIFPLFAIPVANFCNENLSIKGEQVFRRVAQQVYIVAFPLVIFVIHFFLKPNSSLLMNIDLILLVVGGYFILSNKKIASQLKVFMLSCMVMLFVAFYLNTTFYPILVDHKGQPKAAEEVNRAIPANQVVYSLKSLNNGFQFYVDRPVKYVQFQNYQRTPTEKNAVFYADQEAINYFDQHKFGYRIIAEFIDYPQENLLPAFVNHQTRSQTLEKVYLIRKP